MENVQLTVANIEYAYKREEYLGFGYLGGRKIALEEGQEATVAAADEQALAAANAAGLTGEEFFEWLNSKMGRYFGDCVFGANGQHSHRYLPAKGAYHRF